VDRRGQGKLVDVEGEGGRPHDQLGHDLGAGLVDRAHLFGRVRDLGLEVGQLGERDRAADGELAPRTSGKMKRWRSSMSGRAGTSVTTRRRAEAHSAKRPTGSLTTAGSAGSSARASSTATPPTSMRARARRSSGTRAVSAIWNGAPLGGNTV